MPDAITSIHGRKLGLTPQSSLVGGDRSVAITPICADATITVGPEIANVRAITIQLTDANGNNITAPEMVELDMLLDAAGSDWVATGGSTGIAIGASGKLLTIVAKKSFRAISNSSGVIALTYTDTGTEVGFLGLRLANGREIVSAALTNT